MTLFVPTPTNERDGLTDYLVKQITDLRATAFGLTDAQLRMRTTASSLTVGTLIKHCTQVINAWLSRAEVAPGEAPPPDTDHGFTLVPTDTAESLMKELDRACERCRAAMTSIDLDAQVPVPDAPWFPKDVSSWNNRWVILHLIEEIARHAGHADIIRESLDGATMYELVFAADDLGDTDYLTAWKPGKHVAPLPNQFVVFSSDVPRAAQFYRTVLEAEPTMEFPTYVAFDWGSVVLGIVADERQENPAVAAPERTEIAIRVSSAAEVDEIHRRWIEQNVDVVTEPYDAVFGRTFVAQDPDGHRIRVCLWD